MPERAVAAETLLYRRVSEAVLIRTSGDCVRVTSAAFKQTPTLSVVIEDTLLAAGRPPETILAEYDDPALISFPASAAFAHNLTVQRSPVDEEPAHADVIGHRSGGTARSLLAASVWVVAPAEACSTPAG